jgi:hypothetical protein
MKTAIAICALSALLLAACQRTDLASPDGLRRSGRYAGVGLYPAGRMWRELRQAAQDPAAAQLQDDEQVIVVVDSRTGVLRQCGNLSGYCVAMDPWSAPAARAPAALAKHAEQLDREAAEAMAAQEAQVQAQAQAQARAKAAPAPAAKSR